MAPGPMQSASSIGMMRRDFSLQRPVRDEGSSGEPTLSWETIKTVYMAVESVSEENLANSQVQAASVWTLNGYIDSDLKADCRLVRSDCILQIISVDEIPAAVPMWCMVKAREILQVTRR